MASEKMSVCDGQQKQENVFVRLLNFPVVSRTCEMIDRTYSGTKQTHPLVNYVCEVYERGIRTAGNLAVRGVQPAIDKLEPQIIAANSLVCRGLDHLEERIPAIQYSPEKLAMGISEAVSSTLQTAKDGITTPISTASDTVVSLASGGFQLTKTTLSDGAMYVLNSRPVHLAEAGADGAITIAERLVAYVLPPSPDETCEVREGDDIRSPGPEPSLRRIGALVNTAYQRAYSKTAVQLQHTRSQGQDLVARIPGVVALANFGKRNLETVSSTVLGLGGAVAGLFVEEPQRRRQEGTGETLQSGGRVQELVSVVGHQIQTAYVSIISGVKSAPGITVGLAKDGSDLVVDTLSSAKDRLLNNIPTFGLFSRDDKQAAPTGKEENGGGINTSCAQSGSGHPDAQSSSETAEAQVSEETRLLQERVLQEIPTQQKVILRGSSRFLTPPSSKGEDKMSLTMSTHTTHSTTVIKA